MKLKGMCLSYIHEAEGKKIVKTGMTPLSDYFYLIFDDNTFILLGIDSYDSSEVEEFSYDEYDMNDMLQRRNYEFAKELGNHTTFDYLEYRKQIEDKEKEKNEKRRQNDEEMEKLKYLELRKKWGDKI